MNKVKARISAGWAHDSSHYHFQRTHASNAPFPSERNWRGIADSFIGVVAWAALIVVLLAVWGAA